MALANMSYPHRVDALGEHRWRHGNIVQQAIVFDEHAVECRVASLAQPKRFFSKPAAAAIELNKANRLKLPLLRLPKLISASG